MPISTTSRTAHAPQIDHETPRGPGTGRPPGSGSAGVVVGRFDRHLDVVRVALLEARRGDAHQLTALLQFGDGTGADEAHRRAQTTVELVGDGGQRTAVGHLSLNTLRYQLVVGHHIVLEVPILGVRTDLTARLHGA